MPTSTRRRDVRRWSALVVALMTVWLATVWLTTASPVPLYDGIGFPDEPYRFVPPRSATAPAATTASVELKVSGGSNTGGLILNSKETGPQVSVYAPPRAFAALGTAPVVLTVRPVPLTPPLPPGTVDSNVYELSLTSAAGPVSIVTAAQPPAITMRAVEITPTLPVYQYRASPTEKWRALQTRRIGRDNFNATVPGAGEYVLVQPAARQPSSGKGSLYAVLGATAVLMVLVLVGVRLMSKRAQQAEPEPEPEQPEPEQPEPEQPEPEQP